MMCETREGDNMYNVEAVVYEDPKKALQCVLDEVFDGEGPMVEEDEAVMTLAAVAHYAMNITFDRRDIMEHQVNGTLEVWVKAEVSKALMSLAELILTKVKELNG